MRQRLQAITPHDFRLFPVRSPLLGESRLFSFPSGTEMFQFPKFASLHLCIQCRMAGRAGSGCPIRRPPDQSLCSGSPKLFAATYVLHRLLVPRHPPCALSILTSLFPEGAYKHQLPAVLLSVFRLTSSLPRSPYQKYGSVGHCGRTRNPSQKPSLRVSVLPTR